MNHRVGSIGISSCWARSLVVSCHIEGVCNSPSFKRLDRLILLMTKNAATAITAIIKIRHSRLNMASLYRCFRACRCRIVPIISARRQKAGIRTIERDDDPHKEGRQGQSKWENEHEDQKERGMLQVNLRTMDVAPKRLTSSSTSTVPTE